LLQALQQCHFLIDSYAYLLSERGRPFAAGSIDTASFAAIQAMYPKDAGSIMLGNPFSRAFFQRDH